MDFDRGSTYKYQPLVPAAHSHPIRLLKLLPATEARIKIRCEIIHANLEDHEDFEALSYTWGDVKDVVSILLHDRPCYITRSLDSALRHLRYTGAARLLWIDALCINQADVPEKIEQIAKMREIYNFGGASRVIAWLGEEGSAKQALGFCKRLSENKPVFASLPGYEAEWKACRELFHRSWWSRAWILQEVIHSNEVIVVIGNLEPMLIEELCEAFSTYTYSLEVRNRLSGLTERYMDIEHPGTMPIVLPVGRDWNAWIRSQIHLMETALEIKKLRLIAKNSTLNDTSDYPPTLPSLIFRFRNHDTTDFRDKIYAFFGLASRTPMWHNIPVDYTLSKRTFYTIVARAFIMNALIPLLLVESQDRPVDKDQELPSWVSDYTVKQNLIARSYISTVAYLHADRGFPSIAQEPRFLAPSSCEVLSLRGIYVAVITGVYETRMTEDEDLQEQDRLKLLRYNEELGMRGRDFIRDPLPAWQSGDLETGQPRVSHSNTSWGPIFCEIGDIIIVAVGSRIPLVLRESEPGKYLFVGACWLIDSEIRNNSLLDEDPGFSRIMYGRACEGLPDDYEAEIFDIY